MVAILASAVGLNVCLYIVMPKGFFPEQDTGRLVGFIRADQTASFQSMQEKMTTVVRILRSDPAIDTVTAVTGGGFGAQNSGLMFLSLKPLAQRPPPRLGGAPPRPPLANIPRPHRFPVPLPQLPVPPPPPTPPPPY